MSRAQFSIVTPCFRSARTIGEAIESVLAQAGVSLEHIVVDGGSTDGTRDVLSRFPHLTVISEPDRGLYDAINKGLRRASGEFVAFLNADDLYAPDALRQVAAAFAAAPGCDVVTGHARVFTEGGADGARTTVARTVPVPLAAPTADSRAQAFCRLLRAPSCINARFFRRGLVDRTGPFDLAYPISADRALVLRMVRAQPREVALDAEVYAYRSHEGSLTFDARRVNRERIAVEHMAMARAMLDSCGDPLVEPCLRRWHSHEGYVRVRKRLRRADIPGAARALRSILAVDPRWLLRGAITAPRRLAWKVARIAGGRR